MADHYFSIKWTREELRALAAMAGLLDSISPEDVDGEMRGRLTGRIGDAMLRAYDKERTHLEARNNVIDLAARRTA